MSAWRRVALELFADSSAKLETADLVEAEHIARDVLVKSLQTTDDDAVARVMCFVTWLNRHSKDDEQLLHTAIDIVRESVRREPLRAQLWRSISPAQFAAILPLCSAVMGRDVSKEFEREFRFAIR